MTRNLEAVVRATALVGFALAGAVGMADAADLALKAPAATYNWSGCYVGGHVGWGTANNWTSTDLGSGATPVFSVGVANSWNYSENSSVLAGGTVGCNWQPFAYGLVLGVEGEGGYLNLSGSTLQPNTPDVIGDSRIGTGYGLVAARVGYAFFERVLLYGKVGAAFYRDTATITDAVAGAPPFADTIAAAGSKSQTTLAVGGGVEYGFSQHWTGKFEYVFFDRGSSFNVCGVDSALGQNFCWRQDPSTVHTVKVGLNYKF
jgi:outer membrane immunogenic protein